MMRIEKEDQDLRSKWRILDRLWSQMVYMISDGRDKNIHGKIGMRMNFLLKKDSIGL